MVRCITKLINKNKNLEIMMKNIKNNISNALYFVLVAVFMWVAVSSMIQRFKCDTMTETQLFLHIPQSFVCDWRHCN